MDKFRLRTENSLFYISNFINEQEEQVLLKKIYEAPKPKWTNLSNRRLQVYGGVPHEKGMIPESIPKFLQDYCDKLFSYNFFNGKKPNQILVNEYLPGQGIMAHQDGPLFLPCICTISLGSQTVLNFKENNEQRSLICGLMLERRSLVVVQDELYTQHLHSIQERTYDFLDESWVNYKHIKDNFPESKLLERSTRVSITIRCVKKVLKIKF